VAEVALVVAAEEVAVAAAPAAVALVVAEAAPAAVVARRRQLQRHPLLLPRQRLLLPVLPSRLVQ